MTSSVATPRDHRRRLAGESGAALLEAAVIGPVFIVVVLSILEYGLVYRDYLTASDAVADAARTGAVQGNDMTTASQTADYSIIRAMRDSLASLDYNTVERIVVFKAAGPDNGSPVAQTPDACKNGSASDSASSCNLYFPAAAFGAIQYGDDDYFECLVAGDPACGWNPAGDPPTRQNGTEEDGSGNIIPPDYLGVYVRIEHKMISGIFGSTFTIEDASIFRIEQGSLST